MERRAFLGALTAPLIVAGTSSAQAPAPPAAVRHVDRPAPRKGRLKQGVTNGVFGRDAREKPCSRTTAARRRASASTATT